MLLGKQIHNEKLGDYYFEFQHASGLTILVYPKEGYTSTYAVIGTNYGSVDTFIRNQEGKPTRIVEGTAHYLEHKLFESEELDAFARFAKTGASSNAYTSFDKTCYLFSCSDHFNENLEILLDFVTHPYFTAETVQKEQGIIGQEIRMYQDEPGWQVMFNLLRCLYHNHPVKIDIAGTVESISHIDADLLYQCYNQFYSLENMVLAVVGDVTCGQVIDVADKVLQKSDGQPTKRMDYNEPSSIVTDYVEEQFPVTMPSFMLGFKETHRTPLRSLKEKLITGLLLDYIAGDTSELYNRLLNEGLINGTFGYEYFTGPGYALTLFAGDSRDPKRVAEEIKKTIRKVKEEGLDKTEFTRLIKSSYGRSVMGYNDIDGLANELVSSYFEGYHLFDELDIYQSLTVEEAEEQLRHQMQEEYSALSLVLPQSAEEEKTSSK